MAANIGMGLVAGDAVVASFGAEEIEFLPVKQLLAATQFWAPYLPRDPAAPRHDPAAPPPLVSSAHHPHAPAAPLLHATVAVVAAAAAVVSAVTAVPAAGAAAQPDAVVLQAASLLVEPATNIKC